MNRKEINDYLTDNGLWVEIISCKEEEISIYIEWGDWKHDHLFLRNLMYEKGYIRVRTEVTEENGSDCYSAIHYFKKSLRGY